MLTTGTVRVLLATFPRALTNRFDLRYEPPIFDRVTLRDSSTAQGSPSQSANGSTAAQNGVTTSCSKHKRSMTRPEESDPGPTFLTIALESRCLITRLAFDVNRANKLRGSTTKKTEGPLKIEQALCVKW